MNKKTIAIIVAAVTALGAAGVGGAFAMKKLRAKEPTSEETATFSLQDETIPNGGEETTAAETEEETAQAETEATAASTLNETTSATTKADTTATTKPAAKDKTTKPAKKDEKATTSKTEKTTKPKSNDDLPDKLGNIEDEAMADKNAEFKITGNDIAQLVDPKTGKVLLDYSWSNTGQYFYTDDDPWQRNFGYNKLYDMGAPFAVMYYDTLRVLYDYGGYHWMIQAWKGQYGYLFIGSEIGLYYKDNDENHYQCATKDMEIMMQMSLYRDGYGKLFTRPYASHWWITAFVSGTLKDFSDRSELTMIAKLTFKTEAEAALFATGLGSLKDNDGNRFTPVAKISVNNPETYCRNGTTVDFVWKYFDEDKLPKPVATTAPSTAPSSQGPSVD